MSSVEAFQKVRMRLPAHLRAQINEPEDHIYMCAKNIYLSTNVTVSISRLNHRQGQISGGKKCLLSLFKADLGVVEGQRVNRGGGQIRTLVSVTLCLNLSGKKQKKTQNDSERASLNASYVIKSTDSGAERT